MPPKKSSRQKTANKKKIIVVDEGKIDDDDVLLDEESNDESNDELSEESNDIDEDILEDNEDEDDNFNDDYELDDEDNNEEDNSDDESVDNVKTNKRNEGCVHDFADNDNYDDYEDQDDNIDINKNTMETIVKPEDRITKNIMTSYERVRLLGTRAKQLSSGAKPLIAGVENMNPKDIAKIELEHKMTPFIIRRELPSGEIEEWKISELQLE